MFDWGALKRGVPELVQFCIDDLPMYTFLIPTHPYSKVGHSSPNPKNIEEHKNSLGQVIYPKCATVVVSEKTA